MACSSHPMLGMESIIRNSTRIPIRIQQNYQSPSYIFSTLLPPLCPKAHVFCFLNPYNCAFFQLDLSFKDVNWCYFLNFIFLIHHCSNLLFLFSSVPGSLRIVFLFLKSFDYLFLLRAISFELRLASCYIVKSCFECLIVPLLSSAWKTVLQLLPDWALTGQWEGRDQWVSFPPTSLTF